MSGLTVNSGPRGRRFKSPCPKTLLYSPPQTPHSIGLIFTLRDCPETPVIGQPKAAPDGASPAVISSSPKSMLPMCVRRRNTPVDIELQ
jgi:hypothetical protein